MSHFAGWFCSLMFLLASSPVWCEGVDKRTIVIGMGNFEPYFIAENESGVFADIINAVFKHIPNYEPKYKFGLSNTALWTSYEAGRVDAVSNLFDSVTLAACRTSPVFKFRDVAITSSANAISIESVADLKGLTIVTFQGAKMFFGPEFSAAIDPEKYIEVDKPELQARMLMGGRYNVSVGDLLIFLDARKKLREKSKTGNADSLITIHDIFPQIYSRMGFRDQALCHAFDIGLEKIKASGEYDAIYTRYLDNLGYSEYQQ